MTWGSADPRGPGTNVPDPCRDSASPDISSSRYALSTVAAFTVHEVTTSRTVGSRSPGCSRPSRIPPRTWRTSCAYTGTLPPLSPWKPIPLHVPPRPGPAEKLLWLCITLNDFGGQADHSRYGTAAR